VEGAKLFFQLLYEGFICERLKSGNVVVHCTPGGMTDLKADGRIIVMATTENGVAYEFSDLENGQFTYYFVDEGMLQRMADTTPNDGNVTVEEAFDYAKANCIYQSPTISDSFTNDLLL